MTVWLVVLVAGALSYLFRWVPAVLVDRMRPVAALDRASAYAVPVTFAAVAAGAVAARCAAAPNGVAALAPLGAVVAAVVAVRRTGSSYAGIAAGMPVLWALEALLT
jgi:branched-subunit amino acid transport protein